MAKGIENRARSPPAVFDFATSQIQKHGGTKMYYDLVESGKRIKALRKEHGLTQEQLAERLEVSRQTVSKWEAGTSYAEMETPLHELKPATEVSLLIWQSNWLCALTQPLITYF